MESITIEKCPQKLQKLGKLYKEALAHAIHECMTLTPHHVGISKVNRVFSVQQIHTVIIPSVEEHTHVDDRTPICICVWIRDPDKLAELLRHNKRLSRGSRLMPTVHVTVMQYECLACTHYNVVLRIGDEGGYSPAADMAKLKAEYESFKTNAKLATHGSSSLKRSLST